MLSLNATEVRVVRVWSERGESSPFPQEMALLNRLKRSTGNIEMLFSSRELEVILFWAEQETKGHYGTEQYLLEHEAALIDKIETYLADN